MASKTNKNVNPNDGGTQTTSGAVLDNLLKSAKSSSKQAKSVEEELLKLTEKARQEKAKRDQKLAEQARREAQEQ